MIEFLGGLASTFGEGVWDVASGVLGWLIGVVADLIIVLSAALPDGDLMQLPAVGEMWETGLGWLNWWLPIGQLAALLATWIAATIAYYAFQFILRHIGK